MKQIAVAFALLLPQLSMASSLCISHKGHHKTAPGNSLEAMRQALELNSDGIEFDIHHTKDEMPILCHDKTLEKVAIGLPGKNCRLKTPIIEMTFREIRENCALKGGDNLTPIPRLAEVLSLASTTDKFVFIELKDFPNLRTKEIIHHYYKDHPERLRLIAFKHKHLDYFHHNIPDGRADYWDRVISLDLDVIPWTLYDNYGTNIWNRSYLLRRHHYRHTNKETSVWTVSKENRLRKFHKWGVTFITTDDTEACLRIKEETRESLP